MRKFLGICLLAAVVGGPATAAGPAGQQTSPAAKVQQAWLTAAVSVDLAVDLQTITFGPPPPVTVGTTVTLSASASSGLPVSFSSDTPPVCTVSGSAVATLAPGTCTITASQPGGPNPDRDDPPYEAAPDVTQSFQVQAPPAAQTITFRQPPPVTAGMPVTLSASASSGLPVSFSSDTPPVCTVSGSAVATLAAGTCTITASQAGTAGATASITSAGSPGYAAAPDVSRSFQVNPVQVRPAAQRITFGPPSAVTAGMPVTLSASASSGLPVSFTSDTPSVCTASGSAVTTLAAGTCTITASQAGGTGYAAAPEVSRSFQVNLVTSKKEGIPVIVLAAVILAAVTAAAATTAVRRRLRSRPLPAPSVRTVPDAGPTGLVHVHATGTGPSHTVSIQPDRGASTTTMEEARP
jgi:hypothetical protein